MSRARTARTRHVTCTDSLGRPRSSTVTIDCAGDVFVSPPEGEPSWFDPSQLEALVSALNEARALSRTMRLRVVS